MDCCSNKRNQHDSVKSDKENKVKGGKRMETKNIMLWAVIGVLLIVAVFMTVKVSSLNDSTSGNLDTRGWTANEIMNYEMHGTVPARLAQGSNTPASGGMVGGC